MIPEFTPDGLLPPGDHDVTIEALRESVLVRGTGQRAWDPEWRLRLVDNLERLTCQLWAVGIREVFADGSFVEDKAHPNDIDGYFVCSLEDLASGRLQDRLDRLDGDRIWTWDPDRRRPYRGYPKRQLPMWHKYRVELYPHVEGLGMTSGIIDHHGHELEFPAAFRRSRTDGRPRGILRIHHP